MSSTMRINMDCARGGSRPERLENLHIPRVRPLVVEAGHLEEERHISEGRMREDVLETVATDVSLADVLVSVYPTCQRTLRVVGVDGSEAVEPDLVIELLHRLI